MNIKSPLKSNPQSYSLAETKSETISINEKVTTSNLKHLMPKTKIEAVTPKETECIESSISPITCMALTPIQAQQVVIPATVSNLKGLTPKMPKNPTKSKVGNCKVPVAPVVPNKLNINPPKSKPIVKMSSAL